jgi:hypothetical protein
MAVPYGILFPKTPQILNPLGALESLIVLTAVASYYVGFVGFVIDRLSGSFSEIKAKPP